jgi:hypothetical protein
VGVQKGLILQQNLCLNWGSRYSVVQSSVVVKVVVVLTVRVVVAVVVAFEPASEPEPEPTKIEQQNNKTSFLIFLICFNHNFQSALLLQLFFILFDTFQTFKTEL